MRYKIKILHTFGLADSPENDPYLRILKQAREGSRTNPDQCTDAGLVRREFDRWMTTGHVVTPRVYTWDAGGVGVSFYAHRRLMVRR